MTAGGEELFATDRPGPQNAAFLDRPSQISGDPLGKFAAAMRKEALSLNKRRQYLKAAKRAYNYFTVIGNLEAMQKLEPVFRTDQARVNQQAAVVEAIVRSLDKRRSPRTSILTRKDAQSQLSDAAEVIKTLDSARGVSPSPPAIAARIKEISGSLEADRSGLLKPNDDHFEELDEQHELVKKHINIGLEDIVKPVIEKYIEP
jgi:hypothetical protein